MKRRILYLLFSIIILILWEYLGSNNDTIRLLISYPTILFNYFIENFNMLISATFITLYEATFGLLIATCFSFGVMIFCFYKPKLMEFILPVMITSQVIPLIVLAPFFIILFGIGLTSKIAMAAIMSFFPVFVNFAQGYKAISKNIHELMTVYQAPLTYRIRNIYFPLAMPSIMSGLKVSATLSVIGAIVAEFNGADIGLGRNLFLSAKRLEPDLMMSSLIISAIIGYALFSAIKLIEIMKGKWYYEN